jgi:hypothetical protein
MPPERYLIVELEGEHGIIWIGHGGLDTVIAADPVTVVVVSPNGTVMPRPNLV